MSGLTDKLRKARDARIAGGGRLLSADQITAERYGYLDLMDERDALAARLAEAERLLRKSNYYLAKWYPEGAAEIYAFLADQPSEVRHVCGMHGFWQEAYENGAVCPACQQSKSADKGTAESESADD